MRVLLDPVIFELQRNGMRGISRIWYEILRRIELDDVVVVSREIPRGVLGLRSCAVTKTSPLYGSPIEPVTLGMICREYGADVFISTYYSYQKACPSVLMVYDMIPEELGWTGLEWHMKRMAVDYADAYVCISKTTKRKLLQHYETASNKHIRSACCGVDTDFFYPASRKEIEEFLRRYNIRQPYYLMVGSRAHYKSGLHVEAIWRGKTVVCIGGEPVRRHDWVSTGWLSFNDPMLRAAYSGADALLWTSTTEGFGLPLIEAMACGCPVICRDTEINREVCGELAYYTDDWEDVPANFSPPPRDALVAHARKFRWDKLVRALEDLIWYR